MFVLGLVCVFVVVCINIVTRFDWFVVESLIG